MKDKRIEIVKGLFEKGQPLTWLDLFAIVPVSVVSEEANINYGTLDRRVKNIRLLNFGDIEKVAAAFGITEEDVIKIALVEMRRTKQKK